MEELIKKIQDENGITEEKARNILNTIKIFITEKFPMISGAVDNLLQSEKETYNKSPHSQKDFSDTDDFLD